MAWEYPAVSQSRIEFWKQPQYTRKGMLLFTILFGFFGLHHFMLRSPQTGFIFLIANILSLGYCYFYDILQLVYTPVNELNTYGMATPWGAAGIAKGMWKCGDEKDEDDDKKKPPNPWWFFLYSVLLPIFPLAKLAAGDTANAMTGFLNLTVMPLGWIIYCFNLAYDYYKLIFKPADVFIYDVDRIFPFTMLGWDKEGRSSRVRLTPSPDEDACDDCDGIFMRMYKIFVKAFMAILPILLPILRLILPPQVLAAMTASSLAVEQGAKTAETALKTADTGLETAGVALEQAKDVAVVAGEQAKVAIESAGKVAKKMANLATQIPQVASGSLAQATALTKDPKALQSLLQKQTGGGNEKGGFNTAALTEMIGGGETNTSYFDYAVFGMIAAVLGGGFLLHTGRTFADVFHQSNGPNDAPPQHS